MLRVPRRGCGIRGLSGSAGARVGWFLPFGGRPRDGCEQYRKDNPGKMKHMNQIWGCQSLQRPCPSSKARWGKKQKRRRKTCQRLSKPDLRKTYDLRLRSSGTANPRHNSVKEPGSGTVGLPAVMIRAKSPGTEKLLFRNAISPEKVAVSPGS